MRFTRIVTPAGPMLAAADDAGALSGLWFDRGPAPGWRHDEEPFAALREQLDIYFTGALREFDLALAPVGTRWQREVWAALTEVPYGTTVSYGALAARLGRPASARAVGAANGCNPISVVVPCHRLVGASGGLTGYGGGLPRKEWLLRHEGALG